MTFTSLTMAPPDAILGLNDAYNQDANPQKINVGIGIYQDETGNVPLLQAVRQAEQQILATTTNKTYKPIAGDPSFCQHTQALLFGTDHPILTANRAVTTQCPGGNGALRVAADFLTRMVGAKTVWVSQPTWANHALIFGAAGLEVQTYPYFDPASNSLNFAALCETLTKLPAGDVVVLHGCCHNPTGVDPSPDQWRELGQIIHSRGLIPVLDFAYQGFGIDLNEDAQGLRTIADQVPELLICSSFSKNFGLYNERVGALTVVTQTATTAEVVLSNIRLCIRSNYSNPPAHGASIVQTILGTPYLRELWESELQTMRDRICDMRRLLVETLNQKGADIDMSFMLRQNGMFSMSGLNREQVTKLREQHAIYMVDSGRINISGINATNVERLCDGIMAVL